MEQVSVNIKFDGMYKSFSATAGRVTTKFRYTVSGSPEAVAAYVKSQGNKLVKKDLKTKGDQLGEPLYFTTRAAAGSQLTQAQSGNWFVNNEKLEIANSMAEQFPALAVEFARNAMGSIFGSSRNAGIGIAEEADNKKSEENIGTV